MACLAWLAAWSSAWPDERTSAETRPSGHWSYSAPTRPALPTVRDPSWPYNEIDHFILERLEREGLGPSPEADKTTLIRRVTIDLTGLPPTPDEIDAFLADPDAPGLTAYEKLVDRLLASPRYGERMAVPWLYAARYADTSGYQNDGPRYMWRWRDWVIDGFNSNMPYDQFTIEQIAGDMLSGATLSQKIATGFNRNHRGNAEGGIIPEEYAVEYVVDRVDTTATVFLGLTFGCSRCHDHKFDPITQRDFYGVFAYFNNVPEFGRAIKEGNSPPYVRAPTRLDEEQLRRLDESLQAAEKRFARLQPELAAVLAEWQRSSSSALPIHWSISDGLVAHFDLDERATNACDASTVAEFRDGEAAYHRGRTGEAANFDGRRFIYAPQVAPFGYFDKFSLGAWVYPRREQGGTILSRMTDADQADGYSIRLSNGKVQVNFVKRWLDDAIRVETERSLPPNEWHHVMVTYDGSRMAKGISVYVDGKAEPLNVQLDFINQSFATKEPLRIGGGNGPDGRFHGAIDDVRIYNRCLTANEAAIVATADSLSAIMAIAPDQRTPEQSSKLMAFFLEQHAPEPIRDAHRQMIRLRRETERFIESIPTVMVMEEMAKPRDTFLLIRGEYDKHGPQVAPGIPTSLPPLPERAPNNRLGFARWLVDPANPLTARVAVNRYWQMYFGTGLVKTAEDFGAQGEMPSHPELLDWLAAEFARTGWDVKAMQKRIVMSATYRQSSKASPALQARDPENRLLARGPRFRLSAEMIRDQALAASSLLVERLGGPSVKPYQPEGLWKEIATDGDYVQDHGENLYRRSLYTYWKRTVAPPSMITFDATAREACTVRETRTNTPLQALTLMNEVTFVEAARMLAQRIMTEGGSTPEERISLAFRLATSRQPRPAELAVLEQGLQEHLKRYRANPSAALELVGMGESPRDERIETCELAAYTTIASLILNLDEVVTKQ